MAESTVCPQCGHATLAQDLVYSHPLETWVCPACRAAASAQALGAKPRPAGRVESRAVPAKRAVWPIVCTLMTLVLIAVAWWGLSRRGGEQAGWENAHRQEIIALNNDAEALAVRGQLQAAHDKYQELARVVAGRTMGDAAMEEIVATARRNQERTYQLLLNRAAATPVVSSPPSAAVSSAPLNPAAASLPDVTSADVDANPKSPTTQASDAASAHQAVGAAPEPASQPANRFDATPEGPPIAGAIQSLPIPRGPVTDDQVGAAIQHGVDYLMTQFRDGQFRPDGNMNEAQRQGTSALCVYALATCSKAIVDQRLGPKSEEMNAMLEVLKRYALKSSSEEITMRNKGGAFKTFGPFTYVHSLRACALATFNRKEDRKVLQADVDWLIGANTKGSYTYSDAFSPNRDWKKKYRAPVPQPAGPRSSNERSPGRGLIETPEADSVYLAAPPPGGGGSGNVAGQGPGQNSRGPGNNVDRQQPIRAGRRGPTVIWSPSSESTNDPPALPGAQPTPQSPPPRQPPMYPTGTPQSRVPLPRYPQGVLPGETPVDQPPSDRYGNYIWDNSNSQYGLLGVWAGAEVGIEVPSDYWRVVEQHWTNNQLVNGEWGYMRMDLRGRYSMTCAGIASLLVTHDYLDEPLLGKKSTSQPYSQALQKGLAWLEAGDNAVDIGRGMQYLGYSLYGMERVGLASGYKYFGEHNWFIELASRALATQQPDGRFSGGGTDDAVETAYTLLFLARGRHPLVINKLRFDGDWANRPREIANLTNYIAREMERPLQWQVVDAKRNPEDWADAPILYIASQKALEFDDVLIGNLITFVNHGGIIFSHADAASVEFTRSVGELTKKMFPTYPLSDLPAEHAIYTLNYKIPTPRPRLQGVSNGARLLWVHSRDDLSSAWQTRSTLSRKETFQLGANLYLYATGKEKFRNRLDSPIIPPPEIAPLRTVAVARLRHAGNWNPEPGAWARFGRALQWETGVGVKIEEMPIAQLNFARSRVAHLTGTDALALSDAEISACRAFVESGGTLVIDAAGGASAFTDGATPWLSKLLGAVPLNALDPNDRLLHRTIEGTVDVPAKRLRLSAFAALGTDTTRVQTAALGNGRVIFSSCDIASGLLGTNTWGALGYLPEYSEALMKNIVLTAMP